MRGEFVKDHAGNRMEFFFKTSKLGKNCSARVLRSTEVELLFVHLLFILFTVGQDFDNFLESR